MDQQSVISVSDGQIRFDPAEATDLRRRRRREIAQVLIERSEWLLPADRALVRTVYEEGMSAREAAALTGESVRAIRRRLRGLVRRMLSPRFEYVLRHRDGWPPTRRRVATACVLQGRTMRQAAEDLRLTLHPVRRHMAAIDVLVEEAGLE